MIKVDSPVRMTIEEANKKYHPFSYLMIKAEFDNRYKAGVVVAYAYLSEKGLLVDYQDELLADDENGDVIIKDTKDPLDGGSLLGELRRTD